MLSGQTYPLSGHIVWSHVRYIPVGLLEVIPQKLNQRPPAYYARSDLEQLMASDNPSDWIRVSGRTNNWVAPCKAGSASSAVGWAVWELWVWSEVLVDQISIRQLSCGSRPAT